MGQLFWVLLGVVGTFLIGYVLNEAIAGIQNRRHRASELVEMGHIHRSDMRAMTGLVERVCRLGARENTRQERLRAIEEEVLDFLDGSPEEEVRDRLANLVDDFHEAAEYELKVFESKSQAPVVVPSDEPSPDMWSILDDPPV
jgi:hypothetical protein